MANCKLHVSQDFFKELSLKHQQLNFTIQILETFADRAWVRGYELGDQRLSLILDQLEVFVSIARSLTDSFEKLLSVVDVVD
jgi:hypothetical protein